MTALDLLVTGNADFLAFCDRWQEEGRAILPGADWLRDRGMDGQADAWEWAANEPDRDSGGGDVGGVRPSPGSFQWSPFWLTQPAAYRFDLPRNLCRGLIDFKTFPGAIAWFLDRWDVVYGGIMPVIPHEWNVGIREDLDEYLNWSKRYTEWKDRSDSETLARKTLESEQAPVDGESNFDIAFRERIEARMRAASIQREVARPN